MGGQSPSAPPPQGQYSQDYPYPSPAQTHAATLYNPAIFHVFSKFGPLLLRRLLHPALAATLLESPHPGRFLQPQSPQIAAHKSAPKDPPGQFPKRSGLQREDKPGRNLGRVADRFHGHSTLFARPLQLLAECLRSAFLRHDCALHQNLIAPFERYAIADLKSKVFAYLLFRGTCLASPLPHPYASLPYRLASCASLKAYQSSAEWTVAMGILSPPDHTTEFSPPPATTFHSPLLQREMPGLDVLRGVAVLSVVFYHGLHWWLPPSISTSPGAKLLILLASPGWLGVNLFFVLSGFLITGILLDTRTRSNYWKSFYTRRVLRILPLYLVVLLILRFYSGVSWSYFFLCLFYMANFATKRFGLGYGPLWSLAVEEQFYLVWPFLVRRLRSRRLAMLCIGSIVLSPLLRYLSVSRIVPMGSPYSATWLVTDNLAAGALIAILLRTSAASLSRVRAWTLGTGLSSAALLLLGFQLHIMNKTTALGAAFQPEPFILLFSTLLLLALHLGSHPRIFRLTRPLRFYGYISYGLYLFHVLGFSVYQNLFSDFSHPLPVLTAGYLILRLCGVLAAVTLFCFLSRRYFEEYFLRLKDRLVPYTSTKRTTPANTP